MTDNVIKFRLLEDSTMEVIHDEAYSSLRSVEIPEKVVHEGREHVVSRIGNNAFYACGSLENVLLPDTVHTIGNWAFGKCRSLEQIKTSRLLHRIGYGAFYYDELLKEFDFTDNMQNVDKYAFFGCSLLDVRLPSNSAVSVGYNAFYGCHSVKYIKEDSTVRHCGNCSHIYKLNKDSGELLDISVSSLEMHIKAGDSEFCLSRGDMDMLVQLMAKGTQKFGKSRNTLSNKFEKIPSWRR